MVQFDAIGVVVLDGDHARLHSLHIEGVRRKAGESVQSIVARKAFDLNIEPLNQVRLLQDVSEIVSIAVSNPLAYEEINALRDRLQIENRLLQDEIVQRSIYEEIVGSSTSLQTVLAVIEKVARTDSISRRDR